MDWTESAPGVFTKEFSGLEKIYRKMSTAFSHLEREHWGIHCVCRFRPGPSFQNRDTVSALREAWKNLMLEFPGLSVVPDGLTRKIFVVPDAQAVDKWADQTFFVKPAGNADDIIANSIPRDLPSLYYLPSSSEIVFLSQHWRTDAIGTCMLLDRLFSILAQPPQVPGSSHHERPKTEKISPSLEDAAGSTSNEDPELQEFARQYIDNFHRKAVNTGGLRYKGDSTTLPSSTSHQDLVFTKESTTALISACKARHISVTAALHTALAHTVFLFAPPESQQTEYTTVMAINMRPHLPAPYNTQTHACQTYAASTTLTVHRNTDFAEAAANLTREYKGWYSEKFVKSLRWIYRYHAAKLFSPPPPPARPQGLPPPKPPSGVTLSSLGIIEQYLTGIYLANGKENKIGDADAVAVEVDRFRFGVSMMTRQMLLYAWTFRGRLTLSLDYNSAYYEGRVVGEILESITTTLGKELGVENF